MADDRLSANTPPGAFIRYTRVAARLGISVANFYAKRPALEAVGFPKPDPVLHRYHGDDVEAWIKSRRQIRDSDTSAFEGANLEINFDAL